MLQYQTLIGVCVFLSFCLLSTLLLEVHPLPSNPVCTHLRWCFCLSGGSQVSKVTLCVQKFLRRSRVGIELQGQLKIKKELEQVALVATMLVVAAMLEHWVECPQANFLRLAWWVMSDCQRAQQKISGHNNFSPRCYQIAKAGFKQDDREEQRLRKYLKIIFEDKSV